MPTIKPLPKELGEVLKKDIEESKLNEELIAECRNTLKKLCQERKKGRP